MPKTISGRFYFKQTSNGNLIGEFTNYQSDRIFTESADQSASSGNCPYLGQYNSTWQENGKSCLADLEISPTNGSNEIFSLTWREKGRTIFVGGGMLCDNILIGDYHSVEKTTSS